MQSDVWAFGITLWELFSYGKKPYEGMTNQLVTLKVPGGYRLQPPENCPLPIYELMLRCWAAEANDRPTFKVRLR